MKRIKSLYNTVINFLATKAAQSMNFIMKLAEPVAASAFGGENAPEASLRDWANCALAGLLYVGAIAAASYLSIIVATLLTMLLALVLPLLAANLIALGMTILLIFSITSRAQKIVL